MAQTRGLSIGLNPKVKTSKTKTKVQKRAYEKAGRRAESLACWYLRLKGYRILSRRFKTKAGEIDIIAARAKVIAIVEVKQRATLVAAKDSVGYQSQKRIMKTAEIFVNSRRNLQGQDYDLRFDIIHIIGRWRVVHMKNAFRGY